MSEDKRKTLFGPLSFTNFMSDRQREIQTAVNFIKSWPMDDTQKQTITQACDKFLGQFIELSRTVLTSAAAGAGAASSSGITRTFPPVPSFLPPAPPGPSSGLQMAAPASSSGGESAPSASVPAAAALLQPSGLRMAVPVPAAGSTDVPAAAAAEEPSPTTPEATHQQPEDPDRPYGSDAEMSPAEASEEAKGKGKATEESAVEAGVTACDEALKGPTPDMKAGANMSLLLVFFSATMRLTLVTSPYIWS